MLMMLSLLVMLSVGSFVVSAIGIRIAVISVSGVVVGVTAIDMIIIGVGWC